MIKVINQKRKLAVYTQTIVVMLFACACTVLFCTFSYKFDNKYTTTGPQAVDGVLKIDEQSIGEHPIMILVDGWEFYENKLLMPEDFQEGAPLPDAYVRLENENGFSDGLNPSAHFGNATFRMRIEIPEEAQVYTVGLSEVFSAYRLYVNGELLVESDGIGNGDGEESLIRRSISFEAADEIEFVIDVWDYANPYAGFMHPPAFGEGSAISWLLSMRLVYRATLGVVALFIGILTVAIGLLRRNKQLALLYGLLCLFFVGYIAYSLFKTFYSSYYPFYVLENFSFCAMTVLVMLLTRGMCGIKSKWNLIFPALGVVACIVTLIIYLLFMQNHLYMKCAYEGLTSTMQWMAVGYLTISTGHAIWKKNVEVHPLLFGIIVFDTALVMDKILPRHEPIVAGQYPELGSFVLVVCVGIMIFREVAKQYRRNGRLEEKAKSMDRLLQMQKVYYPMIQEKITEAKIARHDLRHHQVVVTQMVEQEQYDALKKYIASYKKKPFVSEPISYCKNEVGDILMHYYSHLAKEYGIRFTMRLDVDEEVEVADDDLCALINNILENAVEACLRIPQEERFITITAKSKSSMLAIHAENSCVDVKLSPLGYFSSKEKGRNGYGIDSIKAVAKRYNGTAEFQFDEGKGVFSCRVNLEA